MPRRSISAHAERLKLLELPDAEDELICLYALSNDDLAIIRQHRGSENRLGFAVQLCNMRYPEVILGKDEKPAPWLLQMVASQLGISDSCWTEYGRRAETRREHLLELQSAFGFQTFTNRDFRESSQSLDDLAEQTRLHPVHHRPRRLEKRP